MPRRTKLIIAASVTLFIALVTALTLLYVNVWSAPSKQDYEQAKASIRTLETQYADLGTSMQLYGSSINIAKPDGGKEAKAGYDKAVSAVDASMKKLEASPAQRDEEVNKIYDQLVKKHADVKSYADGYILLRASFAKCIDVFSVTRGSSDGKKIAAAHKKAADDCLPLLDQMKNSKTSYFADYARYYASAIRKRQAVFDSYAAKKLSDSEASAKITEIASTDLKKVLGPDDGIAKARANASAYVPLRQLNKILDQKIKQS